MPASQTLRLSPRSDQRERTFFLRAVARTGSPPSDPSYFDESFGRVAAESLIAGVPVIASNRGALPETLADAAILLDIPKEYGPESNVIPPSEVAKPWIDAIVKLWDNETFYEDARKRGLERAETWRLERVVDVYERLFKGN